MKLKLTCVLLTSLLVSSLSKAQFSDFDLSKYKLPDIKTSSLDLELDLDHNVQYINDYYGDDLHDNTRSLDFGGAFNIHLYHYRNSKIYQGSQSLSVSYYPSYTKSEINDDVNKDNNNLASFYFSSINRFYNKSSNFIEVSPYFNYRFSHAYKSDPDSFDKTTQNTLSFSAPISIGHGRIEPVQDARLAIYILDELSKHGKIVNQPSEAKILELASEISKIKNKRFFDYRIRKIEELQTIDSFLVANNIVSSNDIVYFTQLNDQWDYAYGPTRNSGFTVNLGFNNRIALSRSRDEEALIEVDTITNVFKWNEFVVGGFCNLQHSKPLNLYWQSDFVLEFPYNYIINKYEIRVDPSDETGDRDNYKIHLLRPGVFYTIRFLPNSRTSIGLSLGAYYTYIFGENKIEDLFSDSTTDIRISQNELYSYTSFDMYYYFSPQLRLQLDWEINLNYRNYATRSEDQIYHRFNKSDSFQNYLSIKLIYSFF